MESGRTSADLVRWAEQIDVEISRFKGAIDEKVNELTSSLSSTLDGVNVCAAQSAHLEIVFQRFVDHHADRSLSSLNDEDVRKRLRQKAQLSEDTAHGKRCQLYLSTGLSGDASLRMLATLLPTCSPSWWRPSI